MSIPKLKSMYNFKFLGKNKQNIYKFFDEDGVFVLYIFKSGWKSKYHCVIEDPQYEETYLKLYRAEDIEKIYGIKTFSRINKLKKLYDSNL